MTFSHAHLYLNHLPVVALPFSLILFAIAWKRKDEQLEKLAMKFLVGSAFLVIPAYLTGEPAEEAYRFPSGTEFFIESHEEIAKVSLISAILVILIGLLGLLVKKAQTAFFLRRACGIFSVFTAVLLFLTASRGGPIRHTEIRTGVPSSPMETPDESPDETGEEPTEHEDSNNGGDEI